MDQNRCIFDRHLRTQILVGQNLETGSFSESLLLGFRGFHSPIMSTLFTALVPVSLSLNCRAMFLAF